MRYLYFLLIGLLLLNGCGTIEPNVYYGAKKNPAKVKHLDIYNYTDSTFPNRKIAQFHNVKSISLESDYELYVPLSQDGKLSNDTIKKYNIPQLRINSELLDSIKNIKKLYIGGFYLERFPYELSKLKSLEFLEISCYNLKYFPDHLTDFKNLKALSIDGGEMFPAAIVFPATLKSLSLWIKVSPEIANSINISNITNLEVQTWGIKMSLSEKIKLVESLGKIDNLKSCKIHLATCDEKTAIKSAIKDKLILKKVKLIVGGEPICI
jgi:hypothetical protein